MNSVEQNTTLIPPQAIDAEISVLGAMLREPEAVSAASELLDETCFYKEIHKKIYLAARNLFNNNQPVDILTVSNELKKRKELELIGGQYYLTELIERTPSAANVAYHCNIVLDKSLLRKLISISTEVQEDCYSATDEATDIIDRAEQKIFAISEKRAKKDFVHIKEVLLHTMEIMEKNHNKKDGITGVATGFKELDNILSGFQNSEMIIIAARPSMGKTAFALNIARNAAMRDVPVGIYSLEMSANQLATRMLCSEAQVDSHKVRTGKLPKREWGKLSITAGYLSQVPIYIDDTAGMNILELRSKARRLKVEKDVGLIIVDYLQLLRGVGRIESRQIEISMISQSLKNLAKELEIPVVALSQLSRAVESRGGERKPLLSDLRESGAIEQDADVVMFIYRPAAYPPVEPGKENLAEIIVAKQRNGPTGIVELVFLRDRVQFVDQEVFVDELPEIPADIH
ncbi:replicative DNA helicase [candidate division KSB1 bacterium]|nr:replicative DNA helicase [candidate division KSB1 bacterium]